MVRDFWNWTVLLEKSDFNGKIRNAVRISQLSRSKWICHVNTMLYSESAQKTESNNSLSTRDGITFLLFVFSVSFDRIYLREEIFSHLILVNYPYNLRESPLIWKDERSFGIRKASPLWNQHKWTSNSVLLTNSWISTHLWGLRKYISWQSC